MLGAFSWVVGTTPKVPPSKFGVVGTTPNLARAPLVLDHGEGGLRCVGSPQRLAKAHEWLAGYGLADGLDPDAIEAALPGLDL